MKSIISIVKRIHKGMMDFLCIFTEKIKSKHVHLTMVNNGNILIKK